MRRTMAALVLASVMSLGLSACGGTQTITMNLTTSGISMSIVATGSASAIAKAKAQGNSAASGATVAVTDGDTHSGAKVCETDVTDQGDTYHLVVYSDNAAITSGICDSMKTASS